MDDSDNEESEQTDPISTLPKVLLTSVISFNTVIDHANLKATSKFLKSTIFSYYSKKSQYIHHISTPISNELIKWLSGHLTNIKRLEIHNKISTRQLQRLVTYKKNIEYIDLSSIKPHGELSVNLLKWIKTPDYCPNLQRIKMVQCLEMIQSKKDLDDAKEILESVQDDIIVERLPPQHVAAWIVIHDTDGHFAKGDYISYKRDGLHRCKGAQFDFESLISNVEYATSDPTRNTFILKARNFFQWNLERQVMIITYIICITYIVKHR